MSNEKLDLMVEGEHNDQRYKEKTYGEGKEVSPLHKRAKGLANVNGHEVRRTTTVGRDELLCLNDDGQLSVASREFLVMESAGDYHCICGENFSGPEEAHEHLKTVEVPEPE